MSEENTETNRQTIDMPRHLLRQCEHVINKLLALLIMGHDEDINQVPIKEALGILTKIHHERRNH